MAELPAPAGATPGPAVDAELVKTMQAARRTLETYGLKAVAARAWTQVMQPPRIPTVVVVGEIKRGKSSLVNALLEHKGASPVDVDITTAAFVRFVPVPDSGASGDTALLFAGGRRQAIDFAELPDWVTTSGRHVRDPKVEELPIGAEVAMSAPLLPDCALVDTPGVGGLNPKHLKLTTTAATTANILLMTCDATSEITEPELEFLKAVTREVNSVLIAVTKIDKVSGWEAIAEQNRRLLRKHAPRLADAPVVGVSNLLALAALETEPGQDREAALRDSGLPDLAEHIVGMCASGDILFAVNGLRAARSALGAVLKNLDVQRSAIVGGQKAVGELSSEHERLQRLRNEWDSEWRSVLSGNLNDAQRETLAFLDQKLTELKDRWKTKLDKTQLDLLRKSPQLYIADMTADLELLVAEVSDVYLGAVAELVEKLQINADISVDAISSHVRGGGEIRRRGAGIIDPQLISITLIGGRSIAPGLAKALGIAAAGSAAAIPLPFTLAVGGVWLVVNVGYRAIRSGRQELQQWLNATATKLTTDVTRDVQAKNDNIRPEIVNEYKQYLKASMGQLESLIAEAKKAAEQSHTERDDSVAELDARRKSVKSVMSAVDAQLSKLTESQRIGSGA